MSARDVVLATAAFLDSNEAAALRPPRADVKRVAEAFFDACAEDLGKPPHQLDGEDVRRMLGEALPARLRRGDPIAPEVHDILDALFDHLQETGVVTQSFEMRHALAEAAPGFVELVRRGDNVERRVVAQDAPFVHGASKLGRNDPCSCGSGKKFKKCHGKNA